MIYGQTLLILRGVPCPAVGLKKGFIMILPQS